MTPADRLHLADDALAACSEAPDTADLRPDLRARALAYAAAVAEVNGATLKADEADALPDGMKSCAIVFRECVRGHVRLTATNWIDHGCPTCAIDAERKAWQEATGCAEPGDAKAKAERWEKVSRANLESIDGHRRRVDMAEREIERLTTRAEQAEREVARIKAEASPGPTTLTEADVDNAIAACRSWAPMDDDGSGENYRAVSSARAARELWSHLPAHGRAEATHPAVVTVVAERDALIRETGHDTASSAADAIDRLVDEANRLRIEVARLTEARATVPAFDFAAFADDKTAWSVATFGPGPRTAGVIDHIRKELTEIAAKPDDVSEWVDVIILAMDGAYRSAGANGQQLVEALVAKMAKNKARTWPDWRTRSEYEAIEHDRTGEVAGAQTFFDGNGDPISLDTAATPPALRAEVTRLTEARATTPAFELSPVAWADTDDGAEFVRGRFNGTDASGSVSDDGSWQVTIDGVATDEQAARATVERAVSLLTGRAEAAPVDPDRTGEAAPRAVCPNHGDTVTCTCTTGALHCHACGHTPPLCDECDDDCIIDTGGGR